MKPITPDEASAWSMRSIPDVVIDEFNKIITEELRSGAAVVRQRDIARRISARMGVPVSRIYAEGWLDVEDAFRAAGWTVEYDKPGYNESYDPTFKFSRKR